MCRPFSNTAWSIVVSGGSANAEVAGVAVTDDGNVLADFHAALAAGGECADRHRIGRADDRGRRRGQRQQLPAHREAADLAEIAVEHQQRIGSDALFGERLGVALLAQPREVELERTVEQRDAAMTELELAHGREIERLLVVGIDPGIRFAGFRAAIRDEGNVMLACERNARVVDARPHDQQRIDPSALDEVFVQRRLAHRIVARLHRRDQRIAAVLELRFDAAEQAGIDGIDEAHAIAGRGQDDADHGAAAGFQPARAGVRLVPELARPFDDALAGRLRHVVVAVERSRHGRDRQPEVPSEQHDRHGGAKSNAMPRGWRNRDIPLTKTFLKAYPWLEIDARHAAAHPPPRKNSSRRGTSMLSTTCLSVHRARLLSAALLAALSLDGYCAGGDPRRRGQSTGRDRRDGYQPGPRFGRHTAGRDELRRGPAAEAHLEQPGGHPEFRADDQSRGRRRRGRGQRVHQGPAVGRPVSVHAAHVRRHAGVQLVRPELFGVRRLFPQRSRYRAAGVRARRRLQPVRSRLGSRPDQLHLEDGHRYAGSEGAAGSC